MPELDQIFVTTATKNDSGYFDNFGIHKSLVSLYGKQESDVQEIRFKISEDQERRHPKGHQSVEVDYFGYWDNSRKIFSLIYPAYFLLNMCFPNGVEAHEEDNSGRAYRLSIIND